MFDDLSITATWVLRLGVIGAAVYLLFAVLPWALLRRRAHRSWFQRSVIALNLTMMIAAVVSAGLLVWFQDQFAQIPRQAFADDVLADDEPGSLPPQNFLLVGIDQSKGLDPDDQVTVGRDAESTLTDTIMILRVLPESGEAHLMSFPRDLFLEIAGTRGSNRINTAISIGGPEALIRTLWENYNIPIHHYVQVNFLGFRQLVQALGGVPMYFTESVADAETGLFVEVPPGGACVTLDPTQALAFVRSRTFQTYDAERDRWETDPTADLGRITRQQQFIRQALAQAIDQGIRNPTRLSQFINVSQDHVVLDDQLTTGDLLDLGGQFADFEPDSLKTYELPVYTGWVGEASVVFLLESEAQDELNVFRGISNTIPSVAAIRVAIRNGSGVPNQGTEVAATLRDLGFTVLSTANAESFDVAETTIRFHAMDCLAAVFLARLIPGDVVFEEVELANATTIELVTGKSFSGFLTFGDARPESDFADMLTTTTSTTTSTTTIPGQTTTTTTRTGEAPEQREAC